MSRNRTTPPQTPQDTTPSPSTEPDQSTGDIDTTEALAGPQEPVSAPGAVPLPPGVSVAPTSSATWPAGASGSPTSSATSPGDAAADRAREDEGVELEDDPTTVATKQVDLWIGHRFVAPRRRELAIKRHFEAVLLAGGPTELDWYTQQVLIPSAGHG